MTLALTLGMSIGIRNTLWMMWGELLGVAVVALAAVIGVSSVMLKFPQLFSVLKIVGACYLFYIGINMWLAKGKLAINISQQQITVNKQQLFNQGFLTAIANPKGWAFMVALLPPFINPTLAFEPQIAALLSVILISEFICMMLYANGGKSLGKTLSKSDNVKHLNKISGSLMILVAIWLAVS